MFEISFPVISNCLFKYKLCSLVLLKKWGKEGKKKEIKKGGKKYFLSGFLSGAERLVKVLHMVLGEFQKMDTAHFKIFFYKK